MTEKTLTFVHIVRICFYCAAFLVIAYKFILPNPILKAAIPEHECFWPPDMIPHPMPPDESDIIDAKPKELA